MEQVGVFFLKYKVHSPSTRESFDIKIQVCRCQVGRGDHAIKIRSILSKGINQSTIVYFPQPALKIRFDPNINIGLAAHGAVLQDITSDGLMYKTLWDVGQVPSYAIYAKQDWLVEFLGADMIRD